jgi:hypothetical protein
MARNDPPKPTHIVGTNKGEELVRTHGPEPGRRVPGSRSYRTSRDATGINAKDRRPIDPRSPQIPPP